MTERPEDTDPDPFAEDVIAGREPSTAILRGQGAATGAVAVGGAIGAVARYAIGTLLPATEGTFPTGTLLINVVGCFLMGILVVVVTEVRDAHPMVRPFLGVGVLGGFTTFSTFSVEAQRLLTGGHLALAGLYLVGTVLAAVLAAAVGMLATRRLAGGAR